MVFGIIFDRAVLEAFIWNRWMILPVEEPFEDSGVSQNLMFIFILFNSLESTGRDENIFSPSISAICRETSHANLTLRFNLICFEYGEC